ncbi:cyclic peptide export ABC transporter [Janthinobacterium agaricidamnosum]|uniref:Cyclic peptide transporter family protein n=1 Tax=Janthinobacterium agaricidamnosum NBRC 102515 = DSM 9628 TaxID=1349767 RepID=W0V518_9BURK|nr:cyclic peptide export ABC transporter [Janthinobacterium agaricidamnosum]CDG82372.1 cyclic peptide transporter family protein [Janthinobacterium agaricidamnosum NBRC 102515 = DSM 9628]
MLSYLIQQSRRLLAAATLASIVSGACSVLMLVQINRALTAADGDARAALAWGFAGIAVLSALSHAVASVLFERLTQRAHAQLRRFISGRVISADFRKLEQIGAPRVQSALSEHSAKVAEFFVCFPAILTNAVVVGGCMVYLALLSWRIFGAAVVVIGLGSYCYQLAQRRAVVHLDAAAREQDALFGHFRSLVDGAKELRLHRRKRSRFAEQVLGRTIDSLRARREKGMSLFALAASWGSFLIYAFIGLVLFLLVGDAPDQARVMTGFALVFLYMVTPLESLLLNLPRANLARVSARRIDDITRDMPGQESQESQEGEAEAAGDTATPLHSLVLQGVCHRYYRESNDDIFTLGPIDLSFEPGQITFLVGGNGSGKTSLAKLLVGLYRPEQGLILRNGEPVTDASRDRYRQGFSAVFSDFHLFDSLLDTASQQLDERGNRMLERLHLHHKVQVRDGAFTTRELSQGQRKRLALTVACLEDRPFLVFDEWAADQDPLFKDVFYREVLPELRALGKTILVISHDDRYFSLADRLVRMENGQLSVVAVPQPPQSQQVSRQPAPGLETEAGHAA